MLEAFLNTKAGASVASGLFAPDAGSALSGAPNDIRSSFDGSGWTVSTGRSSATGARDARTGQPYGPGAGEASPMTAGASPLLILLLLGVAAGYLVTR